MNKVPHCEGRSMLLVFSFMMLLHYGSAIAGITGKISGRVVDAKTHEPLPSANIVLRGTTLGAVCDIDGSYFIINIPPGSYTVVASIIGYEATVKMNVQVSSDHTTPINFILNSSVIEGKEVVVIAERELVKKDVSSSQIVADAGQIEAVPLVRDINSYINMQAGILNDQIRAGGLDQIGYMVDGLASVDNRSNRPLMQVNMSTVAEISIIKGGFNAEFGNVRSGMINVVTRDPDPHAFHVSADMRFRPAALKHSGSSIVSPDNYYNRPYLDPAVMWTGIQNGSWDKATKDQYADVSWGGWSQFARTAGQGRDSAQCRDLFLWEHAMQGSSALGQKEITYGDKPDFFGDMTITGGVPFIGQYLGDLSFLASYKSDWQAFALPTSRDYYRNSNTQLKFVSRITPSMKLGIEGSYGEVNTVSKSNTGGSDNNYVANGMDILNSSLTGSNFQYAWWPTVLTPFNIYSSMIGLSFDHVISPKTFYNVRVSLVHIKNSNLGWADESLRDTTTVRYFGPTAVDQHPWGFYIGNHTALKTQDGAFYSAQGGGSRDYGEVHTVNFKSDITSQVDKYNQVKAGFEATYDDLYTHYELNRYESVLTEDYQVEWSHYPLRLGGYVQDKLEFEGMIANIGLRLDYNDPNCTWFTIDPYSKYFDKKNKSLLYTNAPQEPAHGNLVFSPRLGISHPISENVKLYFSYGHFYSMPSAADMYRIEQGRLADGITGLGNPNALLPKTVAYELGVDWDMAGFGLLHLAGFYKNVDNQINQITYHNYSESVVYNTFNNTNYADIRGFEVQIERNFESWITGMANYTYQVESHGNVGLNNYYEDPNKMLTNNAYEDPTLVRSQIRPWARVFVQFRTPTEWHPALADWIVSPNFNWRSGMYMTWNPNSILDPTTQDNVQWKATWTLDLRVSKKFSIANVGIELFADINNVLNRKYLAVNLGSGGASAGATNDGFSSRGDRELYYKSLHLPMYADPKFDKWRAQEPGYWIAGTDQLGDIKSDEKPYIDMPNRDFLAFQNLRYITFGLKMNF
jgi:outer membrane receptor protein involved in Fe transport